MTIMDYVNALLACKQGQIMDFLEDLRVKNESNLIEPNTTTNETNEEQTSQINNQEFVKNILQNFDKSLANFGLNELYLVLAINVSYMMNDDLGLEFNIDENDIHSKFPFNLPQSDPLLHYKNKIFTCDYRDYLSLNTKLVLN